MARIAVVGAGIVGLSTAVRLQQILSSSTVTVIADKIGTETTSSVAAGLFRPSVDHLPGVPAHLNKLWSETSWKRFDSLAKQNTKENGVSYVSGYVMYETGKGFAEEPNLTKELVYGYRPMTEGEHNMFGSKKESNGDFFTSVVIEPRFHMEWLLQQFRENGGIVILRKLATLEELAGKYNVVVNCAGLGARELVGDHNLSPNRGQVMRVRAPWIKHFQLIFNKEGLVHAIPGRDWVLIGGTFQFGNESREVSQKDKDDIWRKVCQFVPSLKDAEVISHVVGLRPHRHTGLRLEVESLKCTDHTLQVVHNYGHGGTGISLSWGTACHAADLVEQLLAQQRNSQAKL